MAFVDYEVPYADRNVGKPCAFCGGPGQYLCDYPLESALERHDRPGATCDASLCGRCALNPRPNKHYCPNHSAVRTAMQRETVKAKIQIP